ncbi:MAG TPA: V-type ATPase 116kDa subunit family protein [bacterium]|nr:V-type ATPase 116kDa subunit family protein [bacterium]HOL48341.1 V-type ATPase 116kDa subunit family protein [bacterium]HPQ19981.1 V-type ATPase 116kDa subunit family protein [bacterium]
MIFNEKFYFVFLLFRKREIDIINDLILSTEAFHLVKENIIIGKKNIEDSKSGLIKNFQFEKIENISKSQLLKLITNQKYLKDIKNDYERLEEIINKNKKELEKSKEELEKFYRLNEEYQIISKSKYKIKLNEQFKYIFVKLLKLNKDVDLNNLFQHLSQYKCIYDIPVSEENQFLFIIGLKNEEKNIEKIIKDNNLIEVKISNEVFNKNIPKEINIIKEQIKNIEKVMNKNIKKQDEIKNHYILSKILDNRLEEISMKLSETSQIYYLYAFVPESKISIIEDKLRKLNLKNLFYSIIEAEKLSNEYFIKNIPTKFKEKESLSFFEKIIKIFNIPHYKTINPTIFSAIIFVFLFGFMFGDVGQGIVIALIGFFLKYKFKDLGFSYFLMFIGISSMIFGLLYGSFFGIESLIKPLLVSPFHNISFLLKFSIISGIIILALGYFFNMINLLRLNKFFDFFFDKSGLIVFIIYFFFILLFIKTKFVFNIVFLILFLFIIFLAGRIFYHYNKKNRKEQHEKFSELFINEIMEVYEIILGFLSNTISFVRTSAFVLSHAGLMLSIFILFDVISKTKIGTFLGIIIIIIGNLAVICIEGLVVAIQCMRLQYYEFFNKFFKYYGIEYRPIKI